MKKVFSERELGQLNANFKVKFFAPKEIWKAYEWALISGYHIALHLNPYMKQTAYHVIGTDKDLLIQFGKHVGCYPRMFSVIDTHGTKKWNGNVIYHYDDWRRGVTEKYQEIISRLEAA